MKRDNGLEAQLQRIQERYGVTRTHAIEIAIREWKPPRPGRTNDRRSAPTNGNSPPPSSSPASAPIPASDQTKPDFGEKGQIEAHRRLREASAKKPGGVFAGYPEFK